MVQVIAKHGAGIYSSASLAPTFVADKVEIEAGDCGVARLSIFHLQVRLILVASYHLEASPVPHVQRLIGDAAGSAVVLASTVNASKAVAELAGPEFARAFA
jgi:hypothetical protein